MIYIDIIYIYIYIYIYISRAKNIYYILYPYIIICTSCKPPKYFPYTPYKLDIKHLQLHKHCPCRPVVVVVVGWLLVVGCWLLAVVCWLLVVGCWLLLLGTLPGHKKEGTIWLGVITAGAVVIPAHTYIYIYWLVVWNIFPYIGTSIIPTDFHIFHIFQRGGSITNQYTYVYDLFNNDLRPRLRKCC